MLLMHASKSDFELGIISMLKSLMAAFRHRNCLDIQAAQGFLLVQGLILILCCYVRPVQAACTGIACSCSVGTSSVSFGNYDPTSGTATTGTGNVAVTCSAVVLGVISYQIELNAGNSGSISQRFMSLSTHHLDYNLYTTAAHTQVWGDGTSGSGTESDSYLLILGPNLKNYTVYGLLPALQTVPAGTYTDTVTVSVIY